MWQAQGQSHAGKGKMGRGSRTGEKTWDAMCCRAGYYCNLSCSTGVSTGQFMIRNRIPEPFMEGDRRGTYSSPALVSCLPYWKQLVPNFRGASSSPLVTAQESRSSRLQCSVLSQHGSGREFRKIRPSTHELDSHHQGCRARAPAVVPAVVKSETCLWEEVGGPGNWETVQFVLNTCWYLLCGALVRDEFMKSIENHAYGYSELWNRWLELMICFAACQLCKYGQGTCVEP